MMKHKSLTYFAWLSIGAAITTIILKGTAYFFTGSIGLLSDALESFVNLFAAIVALAMLTIAERPPDEDHSYGHNKAEYFSSIIEGILILVAAASIGWTSIERLMHPKPIEQAFIGLIISACASVVNFVVAMILLKAGKKNHSITLEADAHHLLTDVWTSIGVLVGISVVAITGIYMLDPIVALLVALNIVFTAFNIIKNSVSGLMDSAISKAERELVKEVLTCHCLNGIEYHGVRTRQSGIRRFVSFHVLVPGKWTIQEGHNLMEKIEADLRDKIPHVTTTIHIEPLEDPKSHDDTFIAS